MCVFLPFHVVICYTLVFPKEDLVFNLSKSVVRFLPGRWMWALLQCASWNSQTAQDSSGKVTLPAVCSVQMWARYSLGGIIPPAFPQGAAGVLEQVLCSTICTLQSPAAPWALCNMGRGNCACPCSHLPVLCLSPGEEAAVWQCLTLLEEGLSHSPSNAQFKLLLIRIYCRLGAFEPVSELYSSLDAKHIQHDTIGWVVHTENNPSCWPPSWQLCSSLCHPEFSRLSRFHVLLCQKCSGVFGEVCPLRAPLFCRVSSLSDFDLCWNFLEY